MENKRPKRSATDAALTLADSGSSTTIRSSFQTMVLEQQVRQLQAELEHERSLRQLDAKRSQQAMDRLKKQIELSESLANEATSSLEDYRNTTEARLESMREAQNETLQKLRECEMQLMNQEEDMDEDEQEKESTTVKMYQARCAHLERLLEQRHEDEQALQEQLEQLKKEFEARLKLPLKESAISEKIVEDAPPAVMKELHRVRLSLAESQRQERQLGRKVTELEQRNTQLVQEREELRRSSQRLPVVQQQLDQVHGELSKLQAEHEAWRSFGLSLRRVFQLPATFVGPPDILTIQNALKNARSEIVSTEPSPKAWQEERRRLTLQIESKTNEAKELERKIGELTTEHTSLEKQCTTLQTELEQSKVVQGILQREATSLRGLVKTFDGLPLVSAAESKVVDAIKSPTLDTSKRTLQVTLDSTEEKLRASQADNDRLKKELAKSESELEQVKEKFGKLKEALQTARTRASEAENRAMEAEALAGKGSFDPTKSRVLHYTETPLVEILKDEIKVLKRQIEAAKGSKISTKTSLHNPDKLNQRLKENFKEQIATFREGVYLMTGLKIDMLPNTDRPTFRVRSLYSSSEQDHLLLKWPKSSDVSSLDLLNTDFAKALSATPSYQYMTRFHSLPAFLASVQLSLFETTTQMAIS